jgi:uncharacterized protein (TIGR03435 family)
LLKYDLHIVPTNNARQTLRIVSILFGIGTAHCVLQGQRATSLELRFAVASVKPNRTAGCRGRWDFSTSHGTLNAENAPLLRVISRAYNLTDDRVSGPAWMESQCYDIRAKASDNVPESDLMRMLQALLKERFHLVAQRESDERPILALVVDKGGLKMHPYGDKVSAPLPSTDGRILFMARHLPDLCERLGKVAGRPVIDKTGLDGDYLIVLTYHPFSSTDGDASEPASNIFSAVRDQLGLRLEAQRGVVDILKIASVDKVPTAN